MSHPTTRALQLYLLSYHLHNRGGNRVDEGKKER